MTAPPIPMVYEGDGVFRALPAYRARAAELYGQGEIVAMVPHEERSSASHAHYFAVIREAWLSLPEDRTAEFPTPESLRKKALIKAGFRDERTIVCASHAEALRVAAFIRPIDEYSIVSVAGSTVVQLTAKSQSMKAMGKETFQASKDGVLGVLADLCGVEPAALSDRARAA